MEYRELGRSGIKISIIGLGTWQWGSREWGWGRTHDRRDVVEAVQKAFELGINFIDTAEIYGRGRSEELIGEAIRGHREEVIIATKVSPWNMSYRRLLKAADRSLKRLGVDIIDLYQLHWRNPILSIHETMKAMKRLVRDGKIRCIGISNFNLTRMKAAQEALAPLDLASNQLRYNLLDRSIEADVLPYCRCNNISIIAYSPLAQGLLTGKYTENERPPSFVQRINFRFSTQNLKRLATLSQLLANIGRDHDKSPAQVAMNWLIQNECVIAIPGVKGLENVIDDAGASDWRLSNLEIESLQTTASDVKFRRLTGLSNLAKVFKPI